MRVALLDGGQDAGDVAHGLRIPSTARNSSRQVREVCDSTVIQDATQAMRVKGLSRDRPSTGRLLSIGVVHSCPSLKVTVQRVRPILENVPRSPSVARDALARGLSNAKVNATGHMKQRHELQPLALEVNGPVEGLPLSKAVAGLLLEVTHPFLEPLFLALSWPSRSEIWSQVMLGPPFRFFPGGLASPIPSGTVRLGNSLSLFRSRRFFRGGTGSPAGGRFAVAQGGDPRCGPDSGLCRRPPSGAGVCSRRPHQRPFRFRAELPGHGQNVATQVASLTAGLYVVATDRGRLVLEVSQASVELALHRLPPVSPRPRRPEHPAAARRQGG